MGCSCKDADGFKAKLAQAKKLTEETGETHVVYVHKSVSIGERIADFAFMRKETDLTEDLNICCYFLPDGTEVELDAEAWKDIKSKAKKQSKKEANKAEKIEVVAASSDELDAFVKRIKGGEDMTSPEDLQFYQNNAKEIEEKLKA